MAVSEAGRDALIASVCGAFCERDARGRIRPSPAWADLPSEERGRALAAQLRSRRLERALDSGGPNATVRAVLARLHLAGFD